MEFCFLDIWNCIMGTISAVGMVYVTFYVYKHSSRSSRRDNDFTHMVKLYYRIEDDLKLLADMGKENSLSFHQKQCLSRIKVNCIIMIYYLQRIPGIYDGRMDFIGILYGLSNNPFDELYHSKFSEKFVDFCLALRDKKATSKLRSFNYDGKPLEK